MIRQRVYIGCLVIHFCLVFLVSVRQALSVISQGGTVLPRSWDSKFVTADDIATASLGENLNSSNPIRQLISGYTYSAGIETGYGFFAPSVAPARKLVFELKYPDGHTEYRLPRVGQAATGLRLTLLFENIERLRYEPLREMMFKMMAFSIWQEDPQVVQVRAVFGFVNVPNASEYLRGQQESYDVLFAYDFFPPEQPTKP